MLLLVELELARIKEAGGTPQAEVTYSGFRRQVLPTIKDSVWVEAVHACGARALSPLLQYARQHPARVEQVAPLVESIELDVEARRLHLDVSDDELVRRRAAWQPASAPQKRGYANLYVEHVNQADAGCDLDFLVGGSGAPVPRESH